MLGSAPGPLLELEPFPTQLLEQPTVWDTLSSVVLIEGRWLRDALLPSVVEACSA